MTHASRSAAMAKIHVGTSGFADPGWKATVYPQRLPKAQWLSYYERQLGFDAVELNFSYYRMPSPETMTALLKKTTPGFRFTIKAHRSMTHDVLQRDRAVLDNPKAFEEFRQGIAPLAESGRLGCVLAQFPLGFANAPASRDYLAKTIDRLADLRLVVEFRSKSWLTPETFEALRRQQVGFCVVDEPALPPLMPWVPEVTSAVGYVRLHGRNAQQWFGTSVEERYDYRYSEAELQELLARTRGVVGQAQTAYVFFNNCHAGAAAKNARRFKDLLIEQGLAPSKTHPVPGSG